MAAIGRNYLAFVHFGARIRIDVDDPCLLQPLRQTLPWHSKIGTGAEADVCFGIVSGTSGRRNRNHRAYNLFRDGTQLLSEGSLACLTGLLASELHFQVAQHARNVLFVHAGVVGWKGRAIVAPGRSMTGKSSLVAALLRAGAAYYSDEYAVIDAEGRVHPYPKALSIRDDRGNTKQVEPTSLGAVVGEGPIPVGMIVVTRYGASSRWRPRKLTPGEAVLALIDNTILATVKPRQVLTTMARACSTAVALKGQRGHAERIAVTLLRRAES